MSGTPATETAFTTSGQSGRPGVWLRSEKQVRAEVELLARIVGDRVDRIVNFAPPHHLYGHLLGKRLPAYLGVPVEHLWHSPMETPRLPADERILLVCLPSTWVMLRSLADRLWAVPAVTAVHSTGPVTRIARDLLRDLDGTAFRAVEILGSTETGGVAHRSLAPRPSDPSTWTLFDDVTLVRGETPEQVLEVASPRLARAPQMSRRPHTHLLDDLVRPVDERRFELVGRRTRMIKVNGRRIRLDRIEDVMRTALPSAEIVCVPRVDEVRAEHYDVFYTGGRHAPEPAELQRTMRAALPDVPLPRLIRRVSAIPRGATGKVRLDRLLAEARRGPDRRVV
jgi:acyl-coenzyme A synthetase/AMP-(fatty) acid ligase